MEKWSAFLTLFAVIAVRALLCMKVITGFDIYSSLCEQKYIKGINVVKFEKFSHCVGGGKKVMLIDLSYK